MFVHMSLLCGTIAEQYVPRQYFVLTDAGKPVFVR